MEALYNRSGSALKRKNWPLAAINHSSKVNQRLIKKCLGEKKYFGWFGRLEFHTVHNHEIAISRRKLLRIGVNTSSLSEPTVVNRNELFSKSAWGGDCTHATCVWPTAVAKACESSKVFISAALGREEGSGCHRRVCISSRAEGMPPKGPFAHAGLGL